MVDAVRRVARPADLVVVLEGEHGIGDRRRAGELRIAVALVGELPPDELELEVERPLRLAHLPGVPDDVGVGRRVPPPAGRPLGDAAPGAVIVLVDGGIHRRLLVEVSDDARGLHGRQTLAEEEVERGLIVPALGDRLGAFVGAAAGDVAAARAARGQDEERQREGSKGRGAVHAPPHCESRAKRRVLRIRGKSRHRSSPRDHADPGVIRLIARETRGTRRR